VVKKRKMAGLKNNYNIDPLNGKNYHTWKFRMSTLMIEKNIEESIGTEFKELDFKEDTKMEESS
jgi:hypothetical protein